MCYVIWRAERAERGAAALEVRVATGGACAAAAAH
jgi:hypothetical protein